MVGALLLYSFDFDLINGGQSDRSASFFAINFTFLVEVGFDRCTEQCL